MTTQPTSTTPGADNQRVSSAEKMKTATISDNTRDYLILIGKLEDMYDEIYACINRDYGDRQGDDVMGGIDGGWRALRDKLFESLVFSIESNISLLNWKGI